MVELKLGGEQMFCIMIVALVFWLIFDYKKDKKIELSLRDEKERIYNDSTKKD